MGWSVGVGPPDSDLVDVALLAAGKALYLCNRFEAKCRDVLRTMYLVEGIISDPVASLEELSSKLPPDKRLGGTLRDLEANPDLFNVSEDDSAMLAKAREARNLIAHEGANIGSLYRVNVQDIANFVNRLRSAVADLAAGDNIVSTWIFHIEEHREPTPYVKVNYPALIDLWVFGHLMDEEHRASWGIIFHQGLPGVPTLSPHNIRLP